MTFPKMHRRGCDGRESAPVQNGYLREEGNACRQGRRLVPTVLIMSLDS